MLSYRPSYSSSLEATQATSSPMTQSVEGGLGGFTGGLDSLMGNQAAIQGMSSAAAPSVQANGTTAFSESGLGWLDADKDGAILDDQARRVSSFIGQGATIAGGGIAAGATAIGGIAAMANPALGGLITGAGVAGGGLLALGGMAFSSDFALTAAEEYGDFCSDALGTRGPVADDSTDSFYADGETDGWGQAINDWWNS